MGSPIRVVVVTFAVGLALAVILVAVGLVVSTKTTPIGPELVKAGVQLGAATLIGAGVAYMLRLADDIRASQRAAEATRQAEEREAEATRRAEEREAEAAKLEEERRKDDYRARVFEDVVTAYNGVKSVRRILRAAGFRAPERERTIERAMTADDVEEFKTLMTSLTQSQLLFEGVLREVRSRREWFTAPENLIERLSEVETYVGRIIDEWEDTDGKFQSDETLSDVRSLKRLQEFLASRSEGFAARAQEPMREIEDLLRADAYPVRAIAPRRRPAYDAP